MTSLRTVLKGSCIYRTKGQEYQLTTGNYFILNGEDEFDLEIGEEETELVTICFSEERSQDLFAVWRLSNESLLDRKCESKTPILFPHGVFVDEYVLPLALDRFLSMKEDPLNLEATHDEHFGNLFRTLLTLRSKEVTSIAKLSAERSAVRQEIYRRISIAQEFIEASLTHDIDVGQIANAASMSKHHFIRSFKQVTGKTPYQYLLEHRLQAAYGDLLEAAYPINKISHKYKFADISSFSKAFKKMFHVPPSSIMKGNSIDE